MSKKNKDAPEEQDVADGTDGDLEADGPDEDQDAIAKDQPADEELVADLRERLLRSMAETENLRARTEREREDTRKYSVSEFARDMLPVADNLRRALDSVTDELRDVVAAKTLTEGVEMTERQLLQSFEKHGIRSIEPLGQRFDHNFHQAMFEIEADDKAPGTVIKVVQIGFAIHNRLLRPAMVGIVKKPKNSDKPPGAGVDEVV